MRTTSLSTWAGDFVTGQYTGGTISVVDPGANTNQRFHVLGTLGNVTTKHHRRRDGKLRRRAHPPPRAAVRLLCDL